MADQDLCYFVLANYKKVYQAIQRRFGDQPKLWQATVIMSIIYGEKDVIVNVGIGANKNLIY